MKLYEFEGKQLFSRFGLATPRGGVAFAPQEAARLASQLGGRVVLKSQILAGKRGKAGLIRFPDTPEEAEQVAAQLLGQDQGTEVIGHLLVEERVDIAREMYLAITVDRNHCCPVIMGCAQGGMDIEEIAAQFPEKLVQELINPLLGLQAFQIRYLSARLGLASQAREFGTLIQGLYQVFETYQAVLVEVNPLVLTVAGRLVALDAKVELDDGSLEVHPELREELADRKPFLREAELRAALAKEHGVNAYVEMDGDIAVIANGASLGMIAFDALHDAGGRPACFCDLGGNAGGTLGAALAAAAGNDDTRAILVDVVGGGITRLNVVAQCLADYIRGHPQHLPIVARLNGLITEEDKNLLGGVGLEVFADLPPALQRVIHLAVA